MSSPNPLTFLCLEASASNSSSMMA
jgi:hypothetical protein